jgi:hypothetical protein
MDEVPPVVETQELQTFVQGLGAYDTLYIHCTEGYGRSGLVAACVLLEHFLGVDVDPELALDVVQEHQMKRWEMSAVMRRRPGGTLTAAQNAVVRRYFVASPAPVETICFYSHALNPRYKEFSNFYGSISSLLGTKTVGGSTFTYESRVYHSVENAFQSLKFDLGADKNDADRQLVVDTIADCPRGAIVFALGN